MAERRWRNDFTAQFVGCHPHQTSLKVETVPRLASGVGDYADFRAAQYMGDERQTLVRENLPRPERTPSSNRRRSRSNPEHGARPLAKQKTSRFLRLFAESIDGLE